MFLIRLIRYLKGYVKFSATGVFLERFLNMVVRRGVNIWDAHKRNEVMTAYTDVASYKQLRPYAKKTGVRLHVIERHGAPFQIRLYRKRVGLLAGLVFFLLFMWGMGQFVWRIEVSGNEVVSSSEILSTLHELGLKTGSSKRSLDARYLERGLLLDLQQLSWVTVNIDGSTASVEVRERTMPPQMFPDDDKPCNVVAGRAGLIVYMEVYEGQSVLKVGDTAMEGDVIVSGIMEDKKGQDTYKHSRAKIIAQTDYTITVEQPLTREVKRPTGESKRRNYLRVFGADLPLFVYRPYKVAYDLERSTQPLSLFGMALPFSLVRETYDFYVMEPEEMTEEQARQEALRLLAEQEAEELAGGTVLEQSLDEQCDGKTYKIISQYLCNMDIAKEQEILLNG